MVRTSAPYFLRLDASYIVSQEEPGLRRGGSGNREDEDLYRHNVLRRIEYTCYQALLRFFLLSVMRFFGSVAAICPRKY